MNTRALLKGSGIAVAKHEVSNDMLARIMDTDDSWIRERSGIETRFFVDPGTGASELGAQAARQALDRAGVAADEVDYLVCATMTPDHYFPGCGTLIQHALGITPRPALDLRQQCAGFAYGLQVVGHADPQRHRAHGAAGGMRCAFVLDALLGKRLGRAARP